MTNLFVPTLAAAVVSNLYVGWMLRRRGFPWVAVKDTLLFADGMALACVVVLVSLLRAWR